MRLLTVPALVASVPAFPAVASAQEGPRSLVGRPICGRLDELGIAGLEWGLCTNPELKQLILAVERKQSALLRSLDRSAGNALRVDWVRVISELRTLVGDRWFGEYVTDDVRSALAARIEFLNRIEISARSDLIGMWENGRARLQVTPNKDGGINLQAEDSISCSAELRSQGARANGATVSWNGTDVPVELFLSGNALRLSLDLDTFGKQHGCDAGRLVGYYLPVTSPLPEQAP